MEDRQFGFARTAPPSPWQPVCTGLMAAELTAFFVCRVPEPTEQAWPKLLVRALLYVAVTVAAGAAGTLLPRLLGKPYRISARVLIRLWLPAWLLFPAIALFYRQRSPWLLGAAGLAAAVVAFAAKRLEFLRAGTVPETMVPVSVPLPSVFGLPGPEFHPGTKFFIAGSLQLALLLALRGLYPLSGLLLAIAVILSIWRWQALVPRPRRPRVDPRSRVKLSTLSVALTFFAMILWSGGLYRAGRSASRPHRVQAATRVPYPGGVRSSDYLGIILLPPPVKKEKITAPAPRSPFSMGMGKPLVIPFDGPYWYFKAPYTRPAAGAHVAHGRSTEVNVHSTDAMPLMMEAHQELDTAIDLKCCSELELALTNADTRPGRITVGIRLTDTTTPGHPSEFLSVQPLPSSAETPISLDRKPVPETLHFALPQPTRLARFNDITVVFWPEASRARIGARVAVRNFVLVPR